MKNVTVRFIPDGKQIIARRNTTWLDAARQADVKLDFFVVEKGGVASVKLLSKEGIENLSDVTDFEEKLTKKENKPRI